MHPLFLTTWDPIMLRFAFFPSKLNIALILNIAYKLNIALIKKPQILPMNFSDHTVVCSIYLL